MVYQPPTHDILPPTNGISHGILTPYPLNIDPPTHGILTPYPWYIDPLPMVY